MQKLLKYLGIVFSLCCLGIVLILLTTDYKTILFDIVNLSKGKQEKLSKLLNPLNHNLIITYFVILSILGIFVSIRSSKISVLILSVKAYFYDQYQYLKSIPKSIKVVLFCILVSKIGFTIFIATTIPVTYDESYTFLKFSSKGILSSITLYPLPNNHVLHSILTNLSYRLPFSQTLNLRLPNIIISSCSVIVFFIAFSKLQNYKIALLLVSVYAFIFPIAYFSYLSRGYILIAFCFIVCFYATLKICDFKNMVSPNKRYFRLLFIFGTIGFATIPSFLYAYFTCISYCAFYLIVHLRQLDPFLKLIKYGLYTAITVLFFYTPIFIFSGVDAITNNKFVTQLPRIQIIASMLNHFKRISDFLFGLPLYIPLTILAFTVIFIVFKKAWNGLFGVYCLLIVPVILLAHAVIPFPRTWIYLIVPFIYLLGLPFTKLGIVSKMNIKIIGILCTFLILYFTLTFGPKNYKKQRLAIATEQILQYLEDGSIDNVFSNHRSTWPYVLYFNHKKNQKIKLHNIRRPIAEIGTNKIKECCSYVISEEKLNYPFNIIKHYEKRIYLYKIEKKNFQN